MQSKGSCWGIYVLEKKDHWSKGKIKNKINGKLQCVQRNIVCSSARMADYIYFLDMFLEFQHWGSGNNVNQIQICIAHRCTMLQLPPAQAMAPTIWNVRNSNDSCTKLKSLPTGQNTHFELVHFWQLFTINKPIPWSPAAEREDLNLHSLRVEVTVFV